jgi:methylmalonyl-CoA/ethylmalonyl-CoA epimerase
LRDRDAVLNSMIFDHVGIVVPDIAVGSRQILATLPVTEATEQFDDEELGVSVRFFRDASGLVFELIAPFGEQSPVRNTLNQSHRLNQLAYRCPDLDAAAKVLRDARAVPLGPPKPALAFDNAAVQFFWSPMGYVVELIETIAFAHRFVPCAP